YCVSCDWSHLVTWYKAVVNSLVPCDLCDHSQISHVVSNDVRSDILPTTLHMITDWPFSAPFVASAVNHRSRIVIPCWQRPISEDFQRGRDSYVNNTDLSHQL
ncbi:unnamed protein product, partial [Staurois parvus]